MSSSSCEFFSKFVKTNDESRPKMSPLAIFSPSLKEMMNGLVRANGAHRNQDFQFLWSELFSKTSQNI